tara:strand:+ start:22914 stop:23924 length:1011 start_codon:yes stop_codon:yes gene_type:complete
MPTTEIITPQGRIFTNSTSADGKLGLADGEHDPNLLLMFADMIEVANYLMGSGTTSPGLQTVGTGTKSFPLDDWIPVIPGTTSLLAFSAADPTKTMTGKVTALTEDGGDWTAEINVTVTSGAGDASDWIISYPAPAATAAAALPLNGGQAMTGDMRRSGPAGTVRGIRLQTSGVDRVSLVLTSEAEGGSNAGSNLALRFWDDAGALLSEIHFDRATGAITGARFGSTLSMEQNLGTVSGTVAISATATYDDLSVTIDGDTVLNFPSPSPAGAISRKSIYVNNSGNWPLAFQLDGSDVNVIPMNTPPNYLGQQAGTITRITTEIRGGKLRVTQVQEG